MPMWGPTDVAARPIHAYPRSRPPPSRTRPRTHCTPAATVISPALRPFGVRPSSAFAVNRKKARSCRTPTPISKYLYHCYKTRSCNGGNPAAPPGYSNHQSGHALDLNTSASGVYSWLSNHGRAYAFRRTVPSERWHWEH